MGDNFKEYDIFKKIPGWFLLLIVFIILIISFKESFFASSIKEFFQLINTNWLILDFLVLAVYFYGQDHPDIMIMTGDEKTYSLEDRKTGENCASFKLVIPFEILNKGKIEGYIYAMKSDVDCSITDGEGNWSIGPTEIFINGAQISSKLTENPIKIGKKVRMGKIKIDFSFSQVKNNNLGYILMKRIKDFKLIITYSISSKKGIRTFNKNIKINTGKAWFTK